MGEQIVIRRQKINLTCSNEKVALECNRILIEIVANDLPQLYEEIFSDVTHPNTYINLGTLNINLGEVDAERFKKQFLEVINDKMRMLLSQQLSETSSMLDSNYHKEALINNTHCTVYNTTKEQNKIALLYFLQYGRYPWWCKDVDMKSLSESFCHYDELEQKDFFVRFLTLIKSLSSGNSVHAVQRLISALTQSQIEKCIGYFYNLRTEYSICINEILEQRGDIIQKLNISEYAFFGQLISLSVSVNNPENFLKKFLDSFGEVKKLDILSPKKYSETAESERHRLSLDNDKNTETIYVENAGLVLLHPFFTPLFSEIGLLNESKNFGSIQMQQKAIVLLHFLQSATEPYKESEMPFNKILVGMHPSDFVPEDIVLTVLEKKEATELLATVVNYWTALKGSSVEAMQETFFMRAGKISKKDNAWFLQIERKGFDILLEKLPWGFSTIKFPWLQEIIHVEW